MRKSFMVEFAGTPEAGKTTCIERVSNKLSNYGYKVLILTESAVRLPEEIPKGSWDANLWMHFNTQAGIIRSKYSEADVILIDRGLLDSRFYGKKFLWENICSVEQYENFSKQFIDGLYPNLLIMLTTLPEIAIERRGGEGRLVKKAYIEKYNNMLLKFYDEIEQDKVIIDTSELTIDAMCKNVFSVILEKLR